MKKSLFSIWALMICACSVMAQSSPLDYYRKVNQAELAICDSNLKAANKYYKEAFTINPSKPFSVDLSNAFFAAMDVKDYPTAEKYLAQLLPRGLGGKYINRKILGSYQGEQRVQIETILAKYPNDTTLSTPLKKRIREMMDWNQDVREYYMKLTNSGAYMTDSTKKVDSLVAYELYQMFLKDGVANESVTGNGGYGSFIPGIPDYTVIIGHYNPQLFDTLLLKAIYTWDFNPTWLKNMVKRYAETSLKYGNLTINFPISINGLYYEDLIYPEYLEPAKEKRMNEDRAKLGLPSLNDYRKKINARNKGNTKGSFFAKYSLTESIMLFDTESEEDFKKWVSENQKYKPKASAKAN